MMVQLYLSSLIFSLCSYCKQQLENGTVTGGGGPACLCHFSRIKFLNCDVQELTYLFYLVVHVFHHPHCLMTPYSPLRYTFRVDDSYNVHSTHLFFCTKQTVFIVFLSYCLSHNQLFDSFTLFLFHPIFMHLIRIQFSSESFKLFNLFTARFVFKHSDNLLVLGWEQRMIFWVPSPKWPIMCLVGR